MTKQAGGLELNPKEEVPGWLSMESAPDSLSALSLSLPFPTACALFLTQINKYSL